MRLGCIERPAPHTLHRPLLPLPKHPSAPWLSHPCRPTPRPKAPEHVPTPPNAPSSSTTTTPIIVTDVILILIITTTITDAKAAEAYVQFQVGWIADPIFLGESPPLTGVTPGRSVNPTPPIHPSTHSPYHPHPLPPHPLKTTPPTGDYPRVMRDTQKNLPKFTAEQRSLVLGSVDFFSLNFYTAHFVRAPAGGSPKAQVCVCVRARVVLGRFGGGVWGLLGGGLVCCYSTNSHLAPSSPLSIPSHPSIRTNSCTRKCCRTARATPPVTRVTSSGCSTPHGPCARCSRGLVSGTAVQRCG